MSARNASAANWPSSEVAADGCARTLAAEAGAGAEATRVVAAVSACSAAPIACTSSVID
jgi:hypothetical protein